MDSLWSVLTLAGVILLILLVNSYVGFSTWFSGIATSTGL
jgi:hypothetical protein